MKIGLVSMPLSGHLNPMTALAQTTITRQRNCIFRRYRRRTDRSRRGSGILAGSARGLGPRACGPEQTDRGPQYHRAGRSIQDGTTREHSDSFRAIRKSQGDRRQFRDNNGGWRSRVHARSKADRQIRRVRGREAGTTPSHPPC
jgi:hypothetical protein